MANDGSCLHRESERHSKAARKGWKERPRAEGLSERKRERKETFSSMCMPKLKHGQDPDERFDNKELRMGIEVELEHTDSRVLSKQIAKAHLSEMPDYYTQLKKMEERAGVSSNPGKKLRV